MNDLKTPGVYVEEIPKLPRSVAGAPTAVPAFIGVTEKCPDQMESIPVKVVSLLDYESKFGVSCPLTVDADGKLKGNEYVLYDSIRLFFDNGGSYCYITSIGLYSNDKRDFTTCLENVGAIDEITILLAPDAASLLSVSELGNVHKKLLNHCDVLKDRIAILDVKCTNDIDNDMDVFRNSVGQNALCYGAAYYPYLITSFKKDIDITEAIKNEAIKALFSSNEISSIESLVKEDDAEYENELDNELDDENKPVTAQQNGIDLSTPAAIEQFRKKMIAKPGYSELVEKLVGPANCIPPSGAIAGVYCANDARIGVWKAPANVSLVSVFDVSKRISDIQQQNINVDSANGKSVNAIRVFQGKGVLVWGARTLDGFSSEWRYVSVRRLFNYVEESVQDATSWAVFQPNDSNTWINVRCQIENFLSNLWRNGALAGATPEEAFFVNVGLNVTMTPQDILEGKMIVEIGMAPVRPAEFIVLQFSHKVQE